MPYCSACGSKMDDNERFCASCGEQLQPGVGPAASCRVPAGKPRWIYGLVGLVVIALIIGVMAIAWEDEIDIYGMWGMEGMPEYYLEIARDRTVEIVYRGRVKASGRWRIVDNEIRIEIMGEEARARIEGNELILYCPRRDVEEHRLVRR